MENKFNILGVLNVTPDSFFDGGKYEDVNAAVERGLEMIDEGAVAIDVGGASSRPGADSVPIDEERQRVLPVIEKIKQHRGDVKVSIDTCNADIAMAACEVGADIVNDICGFQNAAMVDVLKKFPVQGIVMHMQGTPRTMQVNPTYADVVDDVYQFFSLTLKNLNTQDVHSERIILDPGIGFGKTLQHNLILMNHMDRFKSLGCDLLLGASRKSFIGELLNVGADERLDGSLAAAILSYRLGVKWFRVHDVKETIGALKVAEAILEA